MGALRTRRKKGKCGARGEVTGSEKVGAAICRPPTPDHNRRKRAAGSRPYGERRWMGMEEIRKGTSRAPSPTVGSDSFRLFSIIPKGYNHAPRRNSCRRQFMVKPIHARQGNSLAIGRSAAPGRVPFEHLKQSTFPRWQSLRLRPEAKPPPFAQGRHGCGANPEGKG